MCPQCAQAMVELSSSKAIAPYDLPDRGRQLMAARQRLQERLLFAQVEFALMHPIRQGWKRDAASSQWVGESR